MTTAPSELVRKFYAAGGPMSEPEDLSRFFFGADYVSHTSPPGSPPGPGQAMELRGWLASAFTDIDYELVRLVSEDDYVTVYSIMHGTHSGPGLGAAPTGRRFEAEQMHLIRVADGQIVEHWGVRDDAGMMRQLGLAGGDRPEVAT